MLGAGINIYSGESGLGGLLTNPTELSRMKGNGSMPLTVVFCGKKYADAEDAYQKLKHMANTEADLDRLMAEIISAKLRQHPRLIDEIKGRGGLAWLEKCSHLTNSKSDRGKSWEGVGTGSRFIRNLMAGYERAISGDNEELGQGTLF